MRPRIPRDMLWRNRETIEELLDEPLFRVLQELTGADPASSGAGRFVQQKNKRIKCTPEPSLLC